MSPQKTLIFDFDGTIADSLCVVIDLFVKISKLPRPTPEEIIEYRKLPALQVIRKAHIPLWKLPGLRTNGIRAMRERIGEIKPFAGMPAVIRELSKNYRMLILTSNAVANSKAFLLEHGLDDCFSSYYTASSIFSKDFAIRKVLALQKLRHEDVLYIGDEVRDVEAAKRANIKVIAVTWGYNDKSILQKYNPNALIENPADLPKAIRELLQ